VNTTNHRLGFEVLSAEFDVFNLRRKYYHGYESTDCRASEKLKVNTKRDLAKKLGLSENTLSNWKDSTLTPMWLADAIAKTKKISVKNSQIDTIWPIVEFYEITACQAKGGVSWQIFDSSDASNKYSRGLKNELGVPGIYIFYDSRGQALYVGKSKKQSLWDEMNEAFNRDRVQTIKLTKHSGNGEFEPAYQYDKLKRIEKIQVRLHHLAHYFSAYKIIDGMIDDVEALLIRGFANDLLNIKMEKFTYHKTGGA
jgi:DNA-binding XRE family transcriptional regulator